MTTRPNAAFSSFTASAKQLTQSSVSRNPGRQRRIASIQDHIRQGVGPEHAAAEPGGPADHTQSARQVAAAVAAAEHAVLIVAQMPPSPRTDLFRRAPGQLVAPDDLRDGRARRVAVAEEILRGLDRERERDGRAFLAGLALLEDEASAHGVVRLRTACAVGQDGGERQGVGMEREADPGVEAALGGGIERDRTPPAEEDAARPADRLDLGGDGPVSQVTGSSSESPSMTAMSVMCPLPVFASEP